MKVHGVVLAILLDIHLDHACTKNNRAAFSILPAGYGWVVDACYRSWLGQTLIELVRSALQLVAFSSG
jgi:hypothetical protein